MNFFSRQADRSGIGCKWLGGRSEDERKQLEHLGVSWLERRSE